jgi:hypothetical protein
MVATRKTLLTRAGVAPLLALATGLIVQCGGSTPSPAARASGEAPQPHCAAIWEEGVELAGVVGGRDTQAYFDARPVATLPPGQVSGIVLFPRDRMGVPLADIPIGLAGPLGSDDCTARLAERDRAANDSAWSLRIENHAQVTGHRRLRDGRTEDITFDIVPETPCDGDGEWRTFSSPAWPITFEYPAAWVLTDDNDDIALECPSVARLAMGGSWLSFEQGRFAPRGGGSERGNDESFTDPFWFARLAADDWRVGYACDQPAADAERAGCPAARRTDRNGITMLQGIAGEHRLYRPGVGYLGQGGGITRYLFIAADRWVSLDIAGPNGHYDDIGADGGPVLLDGDAVGDRLVRSIRRR